MKTREILTRDIINRSAQSSSHTNVLKKCLEGIEKATEFGNNQFPALKHNLLSVWGLQNAGSVGFIEKMESLYEELVAEKLQDVTVPGLTGVSREAFYEILCW